MRCSLNDEKFASLALHEARKSTLLKQHGCVAVTHGKILARGCNTDRTYSNDGFIKDSCSCHAEIDVIRKCYKRKFNKIVLYVVGLSTCGGYANSVPCAECIKTIKFFPRIKTIIYTNSDGTLVKTKSKHLMNAHNTNGTRAILNQRIKFNVVHKRQKLFFTC
jgi:tRNA(Arg) A34 adenosine deaminase TadA